MFEIYDDVAILGIDETTLVIIATLQYLVHPVSGSSTDLLAMFPCSTLGLGLTVDDFGQRAAHNGAKLQNAEAADHNMNHIHTGAHVTAIDNPHIRSPVADSGIHGTTVTRLEHRAVQALTLQDVSQSQMSHCQVLLQTRRTMILGLKQDPNRTSYNNGPYAHSEYAPANYAQGCWSYHQHTRNCFPWRFIGLQCRDDPTGLIKHI